MAIRFSDQFDFDNCEDEPIRTPGAVQSFGALRILEKATLQCLAQSDNAQELFARAFGTVTGDPWPVPAAIRKALDAELDGRRPAWPVRSVSVSGGRSWHITAHSSGSLVLVELEEEPGDLSRHAPPTTVSDLATLIQRVKSARTVDALMKTAVEAVRGITGFDRAMVYRFAQDWHGEVIAESRELSMSPFLGLHFPASDIPAQARALYLENEVRLIADVDSPVHGLVLMPGHEPLELNPDLSQCSLRAVSPIHLQYLRNMGVKASMSISIIREGQLWGLIACHHRSPRHVSLNARLAARLVGDVLSLCLGLVEDSDTLRKRLEHNLHQHQVLDQLVHREELVPTLAEQAPDLRRLFHAGGFAVVEGREVVREGHCPREAEMLELAAFVRDRMKEQSLSIYHQNGWEKPLFEDQMATAAGVLVLAPTADFSVLVFWLRPEQPEEVFWAGAKERDTEDPLNPRHSFQAWREKKRGQARPWASWELEACEEVLLALQKLGLRQMERLQRLSESLERSNRDLEDFAFIASHDLQEPLRKIEAFSVLILEDLDDPEPDREGIRDYVGRVANAAIRLRALVSDLLTYSRVGRLEYKYSRCDWKEVVRRALELLEEEISSVGARVTLEGDFPVTHASPVLLRMIFQNLVSNAIKYRQPNRTPEITVRSSKVEGGWKIDICDNGIGFEPEKAEAIFKPFLRLHSKSRYPGSGIGLAIVRKAAERISAEIRADSTPGKGSCFTISVAEGDAGQERLTV